MSRMKVQQTLEQALRLHQANRLHEAEPLYRQVLRMQPDQPDANHLLGVLLHQLGKNDTAVEFIRRAITLKPNFPEAYSNLGITLASMGRFDQAISAYRQTLAQKPELPGVAMNLGIACMNIGDIDQALGVFQQLVADHPKDAAAHVNYGNALKEKSELPAAIAAYRRAIDINPNLYQAHNNLGGVLSECGETDQAIDAFRKAISLRPNSAEGLSNLANALRKKGLWDEAVLACRRAMAINPKLPEAHYNLGMIFTDSNQLNDAISAFHAAIALRPAYVEAHSSLGNALALQGKLDESATASRTAIALRPNYASAYHNLGNALKDQGQLDEAIPAFRQAVALAPANASYHSNLLFALHYHPHYSSQAIALEHQQWNQKHAEPLRPQFPTPPDLAALAQSTRGRRLRIGYISADFRTHPVSRFMVPLLEHHDPQRFEIFCYCNNAFRDRLTDRLQKLAEHWQTISFLSDDQVAQMIQRDAIDILVDLGGHTGSHRLLVFARKPAPVQVSYLGYPNATGVQTIDYRITDVYADPPNSSDTAGPAEKLIRLPRTNWCYIGMDPVPPVEPLPASTCGYVTFGSLNNFSKVTDEMLQRWCQILQAVPNSRLLMKSIALTSPQVVGRLHRHFQLHDLETSRLQLLGLVPDHQTHLSVYNQVDIALDTFPYNGTTTTCDALWMGVPVISLEGNSHVSRTGVSLLSNVGLLECIAKSSQQYVNLAVSLATDRERLAQLRQDLRPRMMASPLMDAPAFARDIEAAYLRMIGA